MPAEAGHARPHRPARPCLSLGSAIGIPADELVAFQGTTTLVSAGDAGANTSLPSGARYIGADADAVYAFVHIANIGLAGFPVPELYNIDFAQVDAAAKAVAENADIVLGVKVRMSENVIAKHGLEPLKRAITRLRDGGRRARSCATSAASRRRS